MSIGRTNAAGKAALNFDVKRYSTEADLLAATPKANTIGIISTTEMTGWIMDPNQPEELTEGMVWISVGTSSAVEFNALKKNGLHVYPISAKQYVGGKLVDVTAKSYQDGEWVDWHIYLCKGGDACVDITGGWSKFSDVGQLTFTDAYMQWYQDTDVSWGEFGTLKGVDITNIKTLYIDAELSTSENIFVGIFKSSGYADPEAITDYVSFAANVREEKALDLSAYSQAGTVYFTFKIGSAFTTKFYNMYLE